MGNGVPVDLFHAISATLLLAGALILRNLIRTRRDLQKARDSLAARIGELATLQSIGREIVSTLDLRRIYRIVERDCRKILDVSRFAIALTDPADGALERVYSHARGKPAGADGEIGWLETWCAAEKRGIRIGSGREETSRRALRLRPGEAAYQSAMAVPLIVEERVVGVLSVQSLLRAAYDEHHLAVFATVAQQAAAAIENARNHRLATVDSLTGAYLRDYFFRRGEEEFRRSGRYRTPFALLMFDLDDFKRINDRHGHHGGDAYLARLGREILAMLRAADLACRYGGDEFCVLLPETDLPGARAMADRIRKGVAGLECRTAEAVMRTTASVGLSVYPQHGTGSFPELLKAADRALYRAKREGKNRVCPAEPFKPPERVSSLRPALPEPTARSADKTGR